MPYSFNWYKFLNPKGYEKVMQEVHDAEVRAEAIDEFADKMIIMMPGHKQDILQIAEQLKAGGKDAD